MEDRRRPILNRSEARVDASLGSAVAEFGGRVFAKVRIGDVLDVGRSGLAQAEWRYAQRAHFDFVVADAFDLRACFAVEFDGPRHQSDPDCIVRDRLKDAVCDHFELPLLRVDQSALAQVCAYAVVGWLARLWFGFHAFRDARHEGEIHGYESFCQYTAFLSGDALEYPYDLAEQSRQALREAKHAGLVAADHAHRISTDGERDGHAQAFVLYPLRSGGWLVGCGRCRAFRFGPILDRDIACDLAVVDAARQLRTLVAEAANIGWSDGEVDALHRRCSGWRGSDYR